MSNLLAALERLDPDGTGHLPLDRILDVLESDNVPVDALKFRHLISHYRMFVDECCATERVNYTSFCRLLSIREQLPAAACLRGNFASDSSRKDTAYRLLCADLKKTPNPDRPKVLSPKGLEDVSTHMKDLITPELATVRGLAPTDFEDLRSKSQIQQIFRSLVAEEVFEVVWQQLMDQLPDQDQVASVNQFRDQMHIFSAETSCPMRPNPNDGEINQQDV